MLLFISPKTFSVTSLVLFFAGLAAFAWTGNAFTLLAPVAWCYILLACTDWQLAYWVLLLIIPCSVRLESADHSLSLTLPVEPMMWLFLLLGILLLTARRALIPGWWRANPIVQIVAFQFLWLAIAAAYSEVPLLSLKFLLAKSWFLVVFFLFPLWIFREKRDFVTAFRCLLVPITATMIIVLIRHAFLDFGFSEINAAIGLLYINHVDYSTVLSMFFPLLCIAWLLVRERPALAWALGILILVWLAAIWLSYARAAVLGVLFAFGIAWTIRRRLVQVVMPAIYGLIALLMVYLVQHQRYLALRPDFEHTYMHANLADHLIATVQGRDMSSMERLYRWIAAIRMSTDRPVFGFGPHGFVSHYKPYALSAFKTYVSRNDEHSTTHNYFLYLLVEQGWPAMILYALLLMVVLVQAQRTYHRFGDPFYKKVTLGLAMLFAASFVNNFFSELLETYKVGALFYLSISLLVILDRKSREGI